jgi:predicted site-specific integrase-resolvase
MTREIFAPIGDVVDMLAADGVEVTAHMLRNWFRRGKLRAKRAPGSRRLLVDVEGARALATPVEVTHVD